MKIRVIPPDSRLKAPDPRLALAYEVGLITALRETEILSLNLEDILASDGRIKVKVKGGRIEEVYLPAKLRDRIRAFTQDHLFRREAGPLFTSGGSAWKRSRRRMSRSTLWLLWQQAQADAGWPEPYYRVHDWRHTAITRFYQRTRDVVATMRFARHRNVQTTMVYTHMSLSDIYSHMEDQSNEIQMQD